MRLFIIYMPSIKKSGASNISDVMLFVGYMSPLSNAKLSVHGFCFKYLIVNNI